MSHSELLAKMELLAPDDYDLIVSLVNKLAQKDRLFNSLSEDELVAELSASAKKSDAGFTKSARAVAAAMRDRYAI